MGGVNRVNQAARGLWWMAVLLAALPGLTGHTADAQDIADAEQLHARVAALLAQLDDGDFRERNEASRQLAQAGRDVVPLLVDALGDDSREVRFRVQALLTHAFDFDDVAPWLIRAATRPYGATVRLLLRDRALVQIADAAELPATRLLFEFWGTDGVELRRQVMFHVSNGAGEAEIGSAVQPLIGLRRNAQHFQEFLERLQALSLAYEHRQGPGHAVARALADGLRAHAAVPVAFADRYVTAFETLAHELAARGETATAIRKEAADRATMSDGAVQYVLRRCSGAATEAADPVLTRIHVQPDYLADELFRGLAAPEPRECYRCVGKAHIADMLEETLRRWPTAPQDGMVAQLVDATAATVSTGDKPKALVLLDALEGCRQLATQAPHLDPEWSDQCLRRLGMAALVAPNTRAYHPVRSVHDRFVQLAARGIVPGHPAFPSAFHQRYLAGDEAALEDDARFALGQYVAVVEKLAAAGADLEGEGAAHFLELLQAHLVPSRRQVLGEGAAALARLLPDGGGPKPDAGALAEVDRALGAWATQWSETH